MSQYKKIRKQDTNSSTFQVYRTWDLNQNSDGLNVQTYVSGGYDHYNVGSATNVSASYWNALSFNFYASASHYEGYSQRNKNHKKYGERFHINRTISPANTKWANDFYSLGHISHDLTRPTHLNKFGKNWPKGNVITVSQGIFGEAIKPGSVTIVDDSTATRIILKDDKRGNLYAINPPHSQSNNSPSSSTNHIGNVFYQHGLIVLKETSSFNTAVKSCYTGSCTDEFKLKFQSIKTMTTTEHSLVMKPNEFQITTNPTVTATGSLSSHLGKTWSPYLTRIGLYDDKKNLVLIGTLSQPVKRSKKLPLTIKIKYDH